MFLREHNDSVGRGTTVIHIGKNYWDLETCRKSQKKMCESENLGNLLRGTDYCLGAARSVVQVCYLEGPVQQFQ